MLQRCFNPRHPWYHRYGGRGITVCESWLIFENFYADMGDPPPGLSIHRINNDGPYAPWNCCWATPLMQAANQGPRRRKKSKTTKHPRVSERTSAADDFIPPPF